MSQKWGLGRKGGNGSSRLLHWDVPLNADPGPSTSWDAPDTPEPPAAWEDPWRTPAPSPEPVAAAAPPLPEPEPAPPPTPAAAQMGERVAQSIGVWQDFVTELVDEVDQRAAEHLAAIDAAAAQRHRELTDAVGAVGDNLQRHAADVAAAIERQAAEVLERVEARFRAIASECASTVAVAEQAAEAWRVTIDNAGTAKQSELDATMAKHLLGVEDIVLRTREGLEEAANTQIARFESHVGSLRADLHREAEDQTLAFEDLAALRLVELEERLGQTVDSVLPGSGTDAEGQAARGDESSAAPEAATRVNGLRSATSS
jgi:phage host-nuclease inhibitor protein Gam